MSLGEWIASWTAVIGSIANVVLVLAGLLGVVLTFRSLTRAFTDVREGRSPTRHYVAAAIGGAITILGVVVGVISNLVA